MYRRINTMTLIIEAGKDMEAVMGQAWDFINGEDTVKAKLKLAEVHGMANGLSIVINAMICEENNAVTGMVSQWLKAREQEVLKALKELNQIEKGNHAAKPRGEGGERNG